MALLATGQTVKHLTEGERCLLMDREIQDKLHFSAAAQWVLAEWEMKGIGC